MSWTFSWLRSWDEIWDPRPSRVLARPGRGDGHRRHALHASRRGAAWVRAMGGEQRFAAHFLHAAHPSGQRVLWPLVRPRAGWKQGFLRRLIPVGTAVNPYNSKGMLFDYHDPVAAPAGPPGQRIAPEFWPALVAEISPPPGRVVRHLPPAPAPRRLPRGSGRWGSPTASPRCFGSSPTPISPPIWRRGARRCARRCGGGCAGWTRRGRSSSGCTGRRRRTRSWPGCRGSRRSGGGAGRAAGCRRAIWPRWCARACRAGWSTPAPSASTARRSPGTWAST